MARHVVFGLALCTALIAGGGVHAQGTSGYTQSVLPRVTFEACLDVTIRTLGGQATHVEFESRQGIPTYEFVVRSGPAQYYAGCDANTGLISRVDVIVERDDPRWTGVAKIDEAMARNTALARFVGGKVEEVKRLLMGDGRVAYEVDLEFDNRRELNVYVDAVGGGIFLVNTEEWEVGGGGTQMAANDLAAGCRDGIAAIDTALTRSPAPAQRQQLERAKEKAVSEQQEQELDECMEAIDSVRSLVEQR